MKDIGQRKTMLLSQGDIEAVVGCCGLKLEVEAAAEALAQRQSPGFVDAGAERCMDNKLHPTAFVEEALGDNCALRGNSSKNGSAFKNVLNRLRSAGLIQSTLFVEPCNGFRYLRHFWRKRNRRNSW